MNRPQPRHAAAERRRPTARAAAVLVAMLATMSGGLVATAGLAGAQADEPNLMVSPDTTFEDGDLVTVTGVGFDPGSTVLLLLCSSDQALGDLTERCALLGAASSGYLADTTGRIVAADVPIPVGQVGSNTAAVCPPTPAQAEAGVTCTIEAADSDLSALASTPIAFLAAEVLGLAQTGFNATLALWAMFAIASGLILVWGGSNLSPAHRRH